MNVRLALAVILVLVAGAGHATTVDDVAQAARDAVMARLGGAQAALVVTGRPAVPPADATLRVVPVAGRFPRARFAVDVLYLVGGTTVGHGVVSFALSLTGEGWVYAQDARAHEGAALLAFTQAPVDAARVAPVNPDAIKGMRLRRNVRRGQPLAMADFEAVPDVDNRQAVRLRAEFGGISLESAGTALRAGNKGQVVTVQVPGATEPVKATVIDRGVAELVQ